MEIMSFNISNQSVANMSNQSDANFGGELTATEILIFSSILSGIIVVGCTANATVAVVLYLERHLRKNIASIFLTNLLLIDLVNLFIVMPFSLSATIQGGWFYGDVLAKLNALIGTSLELASMLALAVISLDRLAAVMKPLLYRARMTGQKALHMNVYIWMQALVFSFLPLPVEWYIYNPHYGSCTFLSDVTSPGFYVYMVLLFLFNFLISLMIILITYFYIYRVARSHSKRISCALQPSSLFRFNTNTTHFRAETCRQREIRTAGKILFVIGAFLICHLPYALVRIIDLAISYNDFKQLPKTFTVACKWGAFSKSAFDPFIYFLLQKRFRRALNRRLFRKMHQRQAAQLSTRTNWSVVGVNGEQSSAYESRTDDLKTNRVLRRPSENIVKV